MIIKGNKFEIDLNRNDIIISDIYNAMGCIMRDISSNECKISYPVNESGIGFYFDIRGNFDEVDFDYFEIKKIEQFIKIKDLLNIKNKIDNINNG